MASPSAGDDFSSNGPGLDSPAEHHANVNPSDTEELPYITRGVYCGNGGTIVVISKSGQEAIYRNIQAGFILPVRARQIRANSVGSPTEATTCTNLVAMW